MGKSFPEVVAAELLHRAQAPDVPPSTMFTVPRDGMPTGPAREFVLACGRRELAGDERTAVLELGQTLTPDEWVGVSTLAQHHRMASLVFKHVAEVGLLDRVPSETAAALKRAYCSALVNNRRMQLDLEVLLGELRQRGVEAMVVKGVALAAQRYHDIALRPATDIDLLVQRRDVTAAMRALEVLGYLAAPGESRRLDYLVLRFLEMHYAKAGRSPVELHLELVRNREYAAVVAVPALFARARTIRVGNEVVRYLDPADELRYLSLHCMVQHRYTPDQERWLWYIDLAELIRSLPRDWDWDCFVDETCAPRVALPVVLALKRTRDLLGLELPPSVWYRLTTAASCPRERFRWYQSQRAFSRPARLWRHVLTLSGPGERIAFILGAAAGAPAFARERLERAAARHR